MRINFRNQVNALKACLNQYDQAGNERRLITLKNLQALPLSIKRDLIVYFDALLFLVAYPHDARELKLAEKGLLQLSGFLKRAEKDMRKLPENSGLPFTPTKNRFSHDAVRWLLAHPHCRISLDSFKDPVLDLNEVLKLTLPSIEKCETTAGLENNELMDALHIPVSGRLPFLINEISRLDHEPFMKDLLYEKLGPIVCLNPKNKTFSKAYNRIEVGKTYFHEDLLRKIDSRPIIDSPVPKPEKLDQARKTEAIMVVKNAMILTARETDPCTYMDESSFRLYSLERGISIAIYGMIPSRQLPLESYVGYTAFKNGFPVSYGGAWIFGERANFGINIFKPYRSGESAYVMAQLLRVYRQVFDLSYFEVEPFQYGLDNPDGIASGAFWFYYRFGFRPLDKHLKETARKEVEKIKTRKGYRTSHKVLTGFTESNIGLALEHKIPPKVADITLKVTRMIQRAYKGDRILAETDCRQKFLTRSGWRATLSPAEDAVFTEVSLWAAAMNIEAKSKLELMTQMIGAKPSDLYLYQKLLLLFFTGKPAGK